MSKCKYCDLEEDMKNKTKNGVFISTLMNKIFSNFDNTKVHPTCYDCGLPICLKIDKKVLGRHDYHFKKEVVKR